MKRIAWIAGSILIIAAFAFAGPEIKQQNSYDPASVAITGGTITGVTIISKETVVSGGTCSTTYNLNPALGTIHTLSLNGACNVVPATPVAGQSFTVQFSQSSNVAPTFDSSIKWSMGSAATWSTTASKYDLLSCVAFGTTAWWCNGIVDIR